MKISGRLEDAALRGSERGAHVLSSPRVVPALITALLGIASAPVRVWAAMFQDEGRMAPLPADPPIGGLAWTVVVPAALFLGAFLGTYLLYRRFSRVEGK